MKAKELMIGDWVHNNHHGKNIKITQYDFFTHIHNECGEQEFAPYAKPISGRDFEPIPLTPEILEKNGFSNKGTLWYLENDNFELEHNNNDSFIWIVGDVYIVASIKYVHELQHALRLCGIEKEIELRQLLP